MEIIQKAYRKHTKRMQKAYKTSNKHTKRIQKTYKKHADIKQLQTVSSMPQKVR